MFLPKKSRGAVAVLDRVGLQRPVWRAWEWRYVHKRLASGFSIKESHSAALADGTPDGTQDVHVVQPQRDRSCPPVGRPNRRTGRTRVCTLDGRDARCRG
jgi:hypothetical protein